MKNTKKIGIALGVFTSLALITYACFWFWMAGKIKDEASRFLVEAQQKDIHVLTRSMKVTGFPLAHEIHFSGRVTIKGIAIEVPMLQIRSTLMQGSVLTLKAPQGLYVKDPALREIWSLDRLRIDGIIPAALPRELTREDLAAWKQAGNNIVIENIELYKNSLYVKSSGSFELDELLQPAGNFKSRITGHMEFLRWLQERGHIKMREVLMAGAVLSGLSKTDGESEQSYIDINLSLQNQTLFAGPLRIVKLPVIPWAWRGELEKQQESPSLREGR